MFTCSVTLFPVAPSGDEDGVFVLPAGEAHAADGGAGGRHRGQMVPNT